MAERRMLLNSTESFVGTMRIEYYCDSGKLNLGLNNNIKIIEEYFNGAEDGYYIVGFKKDLIIPKNFINVNAYCEIVFYSDYNIIFDTRSIYAGYLFFHGNFIFNEQSIISHTIELFDYNYTFNDNCFDVYINGVIQFYGKTIPQYYKNTNSYKIYAHPHILYDLMKYNNVEEGDEEAQNYIIIINNTLTISSSTEYITTIPNVNLGILNNYINSINNYMYNGNYITEYKCSDLISYLRKGITLPQNATVYFPDRVLDIDSDTFKDENNLKKVVIFGNCRLTYLDGFENSSLETIEIYSDKIDTINEYCFLHSNLQTINIPKSIKYIEPLAFDNLENGFVINYKGTEKDWNDIHLSDNWYGVTEDIIVNCIDGSFVVNPYILNTIYYTSVDSNIIDVNTESTNNELLSNTYNNNKGELLFRNAVNNITYLFNDKTQLTEVWLPNYNILSTINAFNNCINLTQINNSKQLKEIEEHTFQNCINLKRIEIDSRCIGDYAFKGCTSLNYVEISKRIEDINYKAFANCTALESIDYEGTIEEWNNIDIDSDWCDSSAIKTIHCTDGDIQI